MKAIEMNQLVKTYGKHRGIDGITLSVEAGDMFGFLGPNGAGKSTSIRCLLGLITPDSGEASVLGLPIGKKQTEILQKVGYMPSEAMFYPSMRVRDIISFAAKVRGADCTAEAARLCERLSVDIGKRIRELSLGNRKKVSIVCALQHKPELLILDEPTSGLDPLMQEIFFELLLERNREGATCFLSSHVLSEVKRYCKNAAIVREGKVIQAGSVEQLAKTKLRYVKVFGLSEVPEFLKGLEAESSEASRCSNVQNVKREADCLSFSYSGDTKELLSQLQGLPLTDLLIEEPPLEDIFMQYYEKEEM